MPENSADNFQDWGWQQQSIPSGWEACEGCGLLIQLGGGQLCVYCRREADLQPVHGPMMPMFETHGAMEEPAPLLIPSSQRTGRRHFFRPTPATSIQWYAVKAVGGEGRFERGMAYFAKSQTIAHSRDGREYLRDNEGGRSFAIRQSYPIPSDRFAMGRPGHK